MPPVLRSFFGIFFLTSVILATAQTTKNKKATKVPPNSVTIQLTDENGKPAANAEVKTWNNGFVMLRQTNKKGYLKVYLTNPEFNESGNTVISFNYQDYPEQRRMLNKEFCPVVYKIQFTRKVDEPERIAAPPIDN
jgi:hypothetical protein